MSSLHASLQWWRDALAIYRQKPVMVITLLGFSAGLPYLLVFSTLTAWLRDAGVERTAIGFFAWVGMTYSIKIFWAPVVDRLRIPLLYPLLGQRRSWIFSGQLGIIGGLLWLSQMNPQDSLFWVAAAALLIAFSSSTQDVSLDAFRIESAPDEVQGAMSAGYILGYRLALLVSGAGAFYIADVVDWHSAYVVMAACMALGIVALFWADEPAHRSADEQRLMDAQMVDQVMGRPMNLATQAISVLL